MPNHLIGESSPYLLQHAHNPVDWYPWSAEALQKARRENKPILISIGYSACHWCHVMEHESFEDEETAAIMNDGFVNIKVDREERPDLDHIYMDAVQAMTGSGGWPLNVFLTPEGKPFYGGTYFPPARAFNRPSWKELLRSILIAFREKRKEIENQSEGLIAHLKDSGFSGSRSSSDEENIFQPQSLQRICENILKTADREQGGFGRAPKFPQTFIIRFLLNYHYYTKDAEALNQACLSLDKMIAGGIYDQLGGGFARYSTDDAWLVPHFEKMLYDNALLVTVISEAYQLTGREQYRRAIIQTMEFVTRELLSGEGGFYSALDADSEDGEGRYYIWEKDEIDSILEADAPLFCAAYDVTDQGNWEEKNILHLQADEGRLAQQYNKTVEEISRILAYCRMKLKEARDHRIRPLLDDKILLGWNALMNIACCKAYAATGMEAYSLLAIENMEFVWKRFRGAGILYFHHSYKNGASGIPAFLDDYACLAAALIQLQEITGNTDYLIRAREITEWVIENFSEEDGGFFFFTHKEQKDIIIRKKEIYDGALPSGNALMTANLLYLSIVFDRPEWKLRAVANCEALGRLIINYPQSFGIWATVLQAVTYGMIELVITGTGQEQKEICKDFLRNFIPDRVFQSATDRNDQFPLLEDKPLSETPLIFLCKEYSCQNPVTDLPGLIRLLETVQKF